MRVSPAKAPCLRFIYEQEPGDLARQRRAEREALSPSALSKLPEGLLDRLEEAATCAEMDRVSSLIDEIGKYNHKLADYLAALADDFAYDKILSGIRQTGEKR